ncbi:hypothetical protein GBA52_016498 [Prunus armeniaca]|nr:hypothetical protein GBA52_016498 [Prunus armeniaca]
MAESVVSFLLDRLASIIEDEVRLLSGTRAEMEDIVEELERIKAFLRVADAKEDSDPQLKVWVKQVRDVAYQIEDALDIFRLSHSCYHRPGCHVSLHELSCIFNKLKARQRIATDIQSIKSKVRTLSEGHQNYKLDVDPGSSKVRKPHLCLLHEQPRDGLPFRALISRRVLDSSLQEDISGRVMSSQFGGNLSMHLKQMWGTAPCNCGNRCCSSYERQEKHRRLGCRLWQYWC